MGTLCSVHSSLLYKVHMYSIIPFITILLHVSNSPLRLPLPIHSLLAEFDEIVVCQGKCIHQCCCAQARTTGGGDQILQWSVLRYGRNEVLIFDVKSSCRMCSRSLQKVYVNLYLTDQVH